MSGQAESLHHLPLKALHEAAGAKFGAFAGWFMPLTYPLGVMKEHLHTRTEAGLFDISHMKLIEVAGREAAAFLSYALPIDADALRMGQSRYNYLLAENGGILDDLIVTRLGDNRFMVVANAGNWQADVIEFERRRGDFDCAITPLNRVLLALQGPKAAQVMEICGLGGTQLTFMNGIEPQEEWLITRSGYTGEDGFEIALPQAQGEALAKQLLAVEGVTWIGLAARDSLRLEAGLCLHGLDITSDINPVEAGLTWAITKSVREKAAFVGAATYLHILTKGVTRRRVGLVPQGRQPVRAGAVLFDANGRQIGMVTSGGFGPSFGAPVAMGYVPVDLDTHCEIFADVRGKKIALNIHPLPFIPQNYFKG